MMEIENDFLPLIFEHDLLYLTGEDRPDKERTSTHASTHAKEAVVQQQPSVSSSELEEQEAAYQSAALKPILVLIDAQFKETEQTLLQNILKALDTKIGDVAIIEEHPSDFKADSGIELFLSFDDSLVKNPLYEINKIHRTNIIYAHSLSTLEGQKPLKMQLWKLLKEMS